MRKRLAAILAALLIVAGLAGCKHDSDVVSENISKDADEFKVFRQIVVYNSITDTIVLEVDGWCAIGNDDPADQVTYMCKSPGGYTKDIIKKADNVFVFVHQLHPVDVSSDYFKVVLKPSTIVPDFDVQ
jgi:hypothetical protein